MYLTLTNRSPQQVLEYFNELQMKDYVRVENRVKPLLGFLGLFTKLKKKVY